jgi:hypothetical protein
MKLQDTTTTIAQIGTSEESQFKMKTSRKAFQILSDLYSDKPLAIVRELGCNASDSMTAAGKSDRPFLIHIPNALEPYLIIQDFGTGISHENIYSIYATYFESTKTNTDEQIGCLGLGSKSPFCYTDNFMVTSIHEGEKRIYNAFFNEQNTPAIALMSTAKTDEENGVAIQIPVKKEHFGDFYNAIRKAFRFFPIKPIIKGGQIDWKDLKPVFKGDGWESYDSLGYAESFAIMGGVTYPIAIHQLESKNHDFMRRGGVVLYFKMGELDFTPSRESLSYCPMTIKALNAKAEFAYKNLQQKMTEEVDKAPTLFDAIQQVYILREKFQYLANLNFDKLTWKGINVSNPVEMIQKMSKAGVTTHSYAKYGRSKFRESINVSFSPKAVWYYDDLPKGTANRIKGILRNDNDAIICLFTQDAYKELTSNKDPNLCFDKSRFLPTSSMPTPSRVSTGGGGGGRAKGVFNVYTYGDRWKATWESEQFDSNDVPDYYIVKQGKDWNAGIRVKGLTTTFNDKHQVSNLCDLLGIKITDVVMVAPSFVKNLVSYGSQELGEYATKKLDFSKISADDIATIRAYGFSHFNNFLRHKDFDTLDKNDPLVELALKVSEVEKRIGKLSSVISYIKQDKQGTALVMKNPNPIHELLLKKMNHYGFGVEDVILILQNLKK